MKHHTDIWKAIEKISSKDRRYKANAYSFVMSALEQKMASLPSPRHISAVELLEGIRRSALQQFGPMAKEVFNFWGIKDTGDFGNIVYNLIEADLLSKTDDDSIEDFEGVYDFSKVFEEDYYNG